MNNDQLICEPAPLPKGGLEEVPTFNNMTLMRVGFKSPIPPRHLFTPGYVHDPRPIAWQLYHPYWITGFNETSVTLMVYVTDIEQLMTLWPEAECVTVFDEQVNHYTFTDRFPRPNFLDEVHAPGYVPKRRIGVFVMTAPDGNVLVGYGPDIDYSMQYIVHRLEYGELENTDFQDSYFNRETLQIEVIDCETIEQAEKLAAEKEAFFNSEEDGLTTTINQENW